MPKFFLEKPTIDYPFKTKQKCTSWYQLFRNTKVVNKTRRKQKISLRLIPILNHKNFGFSVLIRIWSFASCLEEYSYFKYYVMSWCSLIPLDMKGSSYSSNYQSSFLYFWVNLISIMINEACEIVCYLLQTLNIPEFETCKDIAVDIGLE